MVLKRVALTVPPIRRLQRQRDELAATVAKQQAQLMGVRQEENLHTRARSLRFFAYRATFDALALMRRHAVQSDPTPGFQTNWLGVLVDPKIHAPLANRAGTVEAFPYPANWHADIAEWAAVLRAVELAPSESFRMIELGCGWGCWMNNSGVAARRTGREVHVIGIEGDEGHLDFAREALARNGIATDEFTLVRGIAAANRGTALFPRQEKAGQIWGLEPVFDATPEQVDEALRTGSHDVLPTVPLVEAMGDRSRIDLIHIDIQGGEVRVVESCLDVLNAHVGYLMIGTHGRDIEERLFTALGDAGWQLEVERPSYFSLHKGRAVLEVDGVQGWRNPAVAQA